MVKKEGASAKTAEDLSTSLTISDQEKHLAVMATSTFKAVSETQNMLKNETLITCLQEYSFLYNPEDPRYSNQEIRDAAWEEIGKKMKCPAVDCKSRWRSLRDCYRKAMKNREAKSAKNRRPWKFEKQMEFLKPLIQAEKDCASGNAKPLSQIDSGPDEEQEPAEPSPSESPPASSSTHSRSSKKRMRPEGSSVAAAFQNYIEYKKNRDDRSDHIRKYFASVEETARTLPWHILIKVKSQISTIIHEAEYEAVAYRNDLEGFHSEPFTDQAHESDQDIFKASPES